MIDERNNHPKVGDNLIWVAVLVAVITALVVLARTLEVAGCSDRCDYPTLEAVTYGFWWTDVAIFVVTAATYAFARSRLRYSWIIPASGMALTLIALVVANLTMNQALVMA